jgi:serine/threonine protein kinase
VLEDSQLITTETFADRYRVVRQLGRGGMGAVYLVEDVMLGGELVALKVLHAELSQNEKHTKRFLREVQLTRRVTHPNVVRTFDVGANGGRLYFTMEYAEGKTLKERIAEGPLPLAEASRITQQICKGLAAIHQADIIHRDLKPGNVIIEESGGVKITDFGVAKPGVSDLTGYNEIIGSIPYMAPEVWSGRGVGIRADLYALGVMFYEMLVGSLPFEGDAPAELMCKHLETIPVAPIVLRPEIPQWMNDLAMGLLAKDQEQRPVDCTQVAELLAFHLDGVGQLPQFVRHPVPGGYESIPRAPELPMSQFDVLLEAPPTLDEEIFEENYKIREASLVPGAVLAMEKSTPEADALAAEVASAVEMPKYLRAGLLTSFVAAVFILVIGALSGPFQLFWDYVSREGGFLAVAGLLLSMGSLYAFTLASPLLLLLGTGATFKRLIGAWCKCAALVFALQSVIFSVNVLRLEAKSYELQIDFDKGRLLSAAKASALNMTEAALLLPQGTAFQSSIRFRYPVLAETSKPGVMDYLFYCSILISFVWALLKTLYASTSMRAIPQKVFVGSGIVLLAVVPIGLQLAVRLLLSEELDVHLFKRHGVEFGPVVHTFDDFSLVCALLNWILVFGAAYFFFPRLLKRFKQSASSQLRGE